MKQEEYNRIIKKEKERLWAEIVLEDKAERYARHKNPCELPPQCDKLLSTGDKAEIREKLRAVAWGTYLGGQARVYNDQLTNMKGYSILGIDMVELLVIANWLELYHAVKCYILPYVQYSGQEYDRPYSYFKLRVVWRVC